MARIDVKSEPVQRMIGELVSRRVAVTSTLAIFESFGGQFEMDPRMGDVLSDDAAVDCRTYLTAIKASSKRSMVWENVSIRGTVAK